MRHRRPPRRFDRNIVVIGAGSAGLVSAYMASSLRASITLVEEEAMGGDCLNTGCVPSKTLIHAAKVAAQAQAGASIGIGSGNISVDFPAIMQNIRQTISRVAPHDSVERYRDLGVDVRLGKARIVDPWTVDIEGERLTTRSIIIATGAEPFIPPIPGLSESGYLTSDTLWSLDRQPGELLILGGGPIGCELSQAFSRLGTAVTQVEMADRLLLREDHEVSDFVAERLRRDGVALKLSHQALRVENSDKGRVLVCMQDGNEVHFGFDTLLVAVGRKPRIGGFGLEALGIDAPHTVETNAYLQTLYPHIFACGDVTSPYQFTHAAAHEAWHAAVNALFAPLLRLKVDHSLIPAVTFVDPEVARVGLNENEALARDIEYEVTRYGLSELDRALTEDATEGFVKVLTVPGKDRILGATIVGQHAGELLAEFALAMRYRLGLGKLLGVVHAYPTWSEANKYTAGVWKRKHAPEKVLRLLERYHGWRRRRFPF
ncbi:MAG TPA: FAD-dependent oxidoreductase [Gammaproteobacteria bacterium]|nr:FAD-dependent oxidoreductase [Gammaproteobacteria bacterium]